jgi:hypothetical protein
LHPEIVLIHATTLLEDGREIKEGHQRLRQIDGEPAQSQHYLLVSLVIIGARWQRRSAACAFH